MPYLRPSKCLRSSESWKIKPVETMTFCLAMSSVPRVRMSCPRWSIHRFFAEDQTALGMPSLSSSSAYHCKVSVAGQRMRVGPSPSETSAHLAGGARSGSVMDGRSIDGRFVRSIGTRNRRESGGVRPWCSRPGPG